VQNVAVWTVVPGLEVGREKHEFRGVIANKVERVGGNVKVVEDIPDFGIHVFSATVEQECEE